MDENDGGVKQEGRLQCEKVSDIMGGVSLLTSHNGKWNRMKRRPLCFPA